MIILCINRINKSNKLLRVKTFGNLTVDFLMLGEGG